MGESRKRADKYAMRLCELFETPIDDISLIGDWSRNSSFRDTDRKLLQNPKAVQKIKSQWSKTANMFNIMLVNTPEANQTWEAGLIEPEWLAKEMPQLAAHPNFQIKPDQINVIFKDNKGSPKHPMTGWVMAHRLGHILADERVNGLTHAHQKIRTTTPMADFQEGIKEFIDWAMDVLERGYGVTMGQRTKWHPIYSYSHEAGKDNILRRFYGALGTMRSARRNELSSHVEFFHELFAQYIMTGRVRFNPLPRSFKVGNSAINFNPPFTDMDYYQNGLDAIAENLEFRFADALSRSVGKVLMF